MEPPIHFQVHTSIEIQSIALRPTRCLRTLQRKSIYTAVEPGGEKVEGEGEEERRRTSVWVVPIVKAFVMPYLYEVITISTPLSIRTTPNLVTHINSSRFSFSKRIRPWGPGHPARCSSSPAHRLPCLSWSGRRRRGDPSGWFPGWRWRWR